MEYYLLTASFSYVPHQYLKPTGENNSCKTMYKPVVTTHRRTPSAGSLGCGRTHSPKPQRLQTFRSHSVSPVGNAPPSFGGSKFKPPEIMTTPPAVEILDVNNSEQAKESKTRTNLSSPSSLKETYKHRSQSEGGIMNKSSINFRPIGRSFSNPNPPVLECQNTDDVPKSGRFSPYETLTEKELTESRKFGEEAVRINNQSTSGNYGKKSSNSVTDSQRKEQELGEYKEKIRKFENGEEGKLHPRYDIVAKKTCNVLYQIRAVVTKLSVWF